MGLCISHGIGIPFQKSGISWSSYWTLPTGLPEANKAKDEIVFCLMEIQGNNFVDGVNGWEFPITNKDWTSDEGHWTGDDTIFPFKTAATLAAPSDAATKAKIIPYDVNNFWYAVDGTPNQIPVNAFFQNIDFANKCFCKHVAHEVNANLEEIKPAGVKYITLYSSAKTIDSFYSDFFGSEVILPTSDILFVSKSGNDTTGDGTWSKPYLTIDKGMKTIASTKTVWVLSGTYNEASQGYDYLRINRNATTILVKSAGNVQLTSANAGYVAYFEGYPILVSLYGLTLQGKNIYVTGSGTVWDRIKFQTGATCGNGGAVTISNSVINGTFSASGRTKFFIGNLLLNGNALITVNNDYETIQYCKVKTTAGNNNNGFNYGTIHSGCEFKYCYFDMVGNGRGILFGSCKIQTTPHVTTIERCYFNTTYAGIYGAATDVSANTTYKLIVKYCQFYDKNTNAVATEGYGINLTNLAPYHLSHEFYYNYFKSNNIGQSNAMVIIPTWGVNPLKIYQNRFFNDSDSGTCISFGEGTTGAIDGTEIVGNYIRGCLYNHPTQLTSSTHGLLANGGKNFIIKYNRFEYLPLGCVVKANTGLTNTSGGVFYNTFFNNVAHFYYRRAQAVSTYGNTFKNTTIQCSRIGAVDEQGYACESPVFKNNIFTYNGNQLYFALADSVLQDAAGDVSFDDNIFGEDTQKVIYSFAALIQLTYAQAVTDGYIVNGEQATPVFTDGTNGDLSLQAGSAGRGDGTDLGADLDDGLDVSTDWNNDPDDDDTDNYPTIVTKQQGASWDKGAYVH